MIQIKFQQSHEDQYLPCLNTPNKFESPISKPKEQDSTKEKPQYQKFRKCVWTREEDQLLKAKVEEKGPLQWASIASFLPNRSGKQCRERWHNHLREGVTKKAWDFHQFWILALCVRAFGKRWSAISEFIPGRSDNTIKNQWNCKMKPYKHQFDNRIEKLLSNPQLWTSLSADQQLLIKKISKRKPEEGFQDFQNNLEVKKFFENYTSMLEKGLSEYYDTKNQIFMSSTSEKSDAKLKYEQMSEGEEPGDLSVAISAGDCIFYESEEENPILPKCLFG